MKKLIIIGAGGFGRETLQWATDCQAAGSDWTVGGFIDDNLNALDGFDLEVPILGTISKYLPNPDDVFVSAIGNPKLRQAVIERFGTDRNFVNVIHPSAIVGSHVRLGRGVVICPYSVLTTNVEVGDHTLINIRCSIGHDATIGAFCQLSSFCDVTGGVTLEDRVLMGSHASVLPGIRVGRESIVGAGSIVVTHVKPGTTVFGVPAKRIK